MARQIDYYFSTQSPWAYIGHATFKALADANALKINYKPVVLVDLFSETGGLPLAKRHPARQRYRMVELQRWREKRGLNFNLQPKHWPFNARLADGLVIAATEAGKNPDAFLSSAYAGVWEGELDLADKDTLIRLANDAGLPGADLVARSASDDIGAIYAKYERDAVAAGVFGSPAYVLEGEVFWGQDRIELLADALTSGRKAFSPDVVSA
jgi:2-hydroxychromene-2-carboxylate isomerase